MTRYSDAALLKGDYAQLAAEMRAGKRAAPNENDWEKAGCANKAEEAAQEVAKHIFAVQQSLNGETEQLDILTYSALGQMKVIAIHPGDGDILRVDGFLMPEGRPASVVLHASTLSLTFVPVPVDADKETKDESLQIGFVIFDELQERQKARYAKKGKKPAKVDISKPFGLPSQRKPVAKTTGKPAKGKSA